MRRVTICLVVMVLWSWVGSAGQEASVKGLRYPRIVARFHRYNQRKVFGPVTLCTPTHWSVFRVSTVMVLAVSNSNGSGGWDPEIGFADEHATTTTAAANALGASLPPGSITQGVASVVDEGNQPLTFQVNQVGDASNTEYSVSVVVEQLE